jgi:hypothetical protein
MIGRLGLMLLILVALGASSSASAAGHDPRDPQKRHNPADQAWATKMRIQRVDLGAGDWRVEASTSDDDRGAPKECRNPDISDLVETGSAENPDYSRNGSFVGSGSIVFLNERQATKAWSLVARQPLTQCLVAAFQKGLAGSGARLKILSDVPIAMPKLAPHFKAGRIRFEISGQGKTIKGRLSFYLLARGRASVMLMMASFDRPMQPISLALERHLATVVAQRLQP